MGMSSENYIQVCGHYLLDRSVGDYFDEIVQLPGGGTQTDTIARFDELMCPVCGVEFQISIQNCGLQGKAVVVTRWMDLGAGLELNDPKWLRITKDNTFNGQYCAPILSSRRIWRMFLHALGLMD
ncbi:hypothetical protein BJX64DRAFT_246838, partial [Aspergillus heterothallicus]